MTLADKPNSVLSIAAGAWLLTITPVALGFFLAWREMGDFCYALDDSFIMLAISKNLAQYGVWGTSPYEFAGAASSPLFTVLLAGAIALFGDHIWIPLVLNLLAFTGLFWWLGNRAKAWGFQPWQTWFLLMGVSIFAPIPVLLWGSMEHILHIWICLACIEQVVEKQKNTSLPIWILLGALLAGIRFEGLFLGAGIVLWFWWNRKWMAGSAFGFGLLLPVCILGAYSLSKGGYFLPNSLILKGINVNIQRTGSISGFLYSWVSKATSNPHALVVLLMLALSVQFKPKVMSKTQLYLALVLWMSILHFAFGMYGHVYRYEAYLMAASWIALWKFAVVDLKVTSLNDVRTLLFPTWTQAFLVLLLLYPPLIRSAKSMATGTRAMVNIYEQQVQMGKFVRHHYNHSPLVAIDIGAICYFAQPHLIDAFGLASLDVAKAKMNGTYSFEYMDTLCRQKGVEVAIIYSHKIDSSSWYLAGSWVIKNNAVCVKDTVDFYGFNPKAAKLLQVNMQQFQSHLPKTVRAIYYPIIPKFGRTTNR